MKRNLNIKLTSRDGKPMTNGDGKPATFADCIVASLDQYAGANKREIGKLADRIDANKKPPKDTELTPEDAKLIIAAMDQPGGYIARAVNVIADYLEAK